MPPMRALSPSDLDAIPRLGWVREPTPVTSLDALADELGLAFLGVKRDDLGEALHGGSKPRKLDYLLASPPFADAPAWSSSGGIGSGSLVAITQAAAKLDRRLRAHVFATPISDGVLDNLACTASGPTSLFYYGSSAAMAIRNPSILLGKQEGGAPVIPPGATTPIGMIGTVRAGVELASQIREGAIPEPERVYVALGSGGTAVGLALGLALGGVGTKVVAVSVVERMLSPMWRMRSLARAVIAELARHGLSAPEGALPLTIDRAHLGDAYAHPTEASLAMCETIKSHGVHLDPVYTGKAMCALIDDARRHRVSRALFWCTVRRALPDPDPHWRDKLPPRLRAAIDRPPRKKLVTRRRVLVAVGAAAAVTFAVRVSGYADVAGFPGEVLMAWEALVLRAAAEALIVGATAAELDEVPRRVDRYLAGMPASMKREVHGMMILIEHGTTPIGHELHRFSQLAPSDRERYLAGLEARGGVTSEAYRGLRDLAMLGYYQQPSTFHDLGYDGPKVPADRDRAAWPAYTSLLAPAGSLPKGIVP
jgi:D-cysteine desulfhydrase